MSLSCDCGWDGPDRCWEEEKVARVEHRCGECGKTIMPGETYVRDTTLYEGEFSHYKQCESCSDLMNSMMDLGFCMTFGNLLEDHAEYLEQYAPPKMGEKNETVSL